jgi:glycosyltransferase involved in cell wall biosynthesis
MDADAALSIVHVIGNSVIGGAERHVRELALAQRERGHAVEVVAPRTGPLTHALTRDGISVHCREIVFPRPGDEYALDPAALAWLTRYLERRHADVVHSHLYPAHLHATPAAREAGVRAILHTAHTLVVRTGDVLLARLANATTIATARSVAVALERAGVPADHIRVVYNGVGREHLEAPRAERRLEQPDEIVLAVSRLSPEKGLDDLLRAMALVRVARPRARLLVAGDGPERPRLEALAAELRLGDVVHFLGTRKDTAALYRSCDVFALPSREEACSLALLEAMAAGAPIAVTAVGGNPELVRDGLDGSLVPANDPSSLAAAIRSLLEDHAAAAALGASARRRVRSRFRLARMVDETIASYRELLARATLAATRR